MTQTTTEKSTSACEIDVVRERRRQRQRDAQLLRHLPLAYGLARKYAGLCETEEELAAIATTGLLRAVEAYDSACGQPFQAIAETLIVAELEDHVRDTRAALDARRRAIQRQAEAAESQWEIGEAMARQAHVRELADSLGCGVADLVDGLLTAANRDLNLLADKPAGFGSEHAAAG
jgi:RNA polymerase sigma-B factor